MIDHGHNELSVDLLTQIEQHLRILVRIQLSPVYTSHISTTEMQKLYKATGTKTISALAKEFGMSTGKISSLWQAWEQLGLLKKTGKQYERVL